MVQSLSITGGMTVVRFCLKCSRISATFEALVDFVTGMTFILAGEEGRVLAAVVGTDAREVGVITREDKCTPASAFTCGIQNKLEVNCCCDKSH